MIHDGARLVLVVLLAVLAVIASGSAYIAVKLSDTVNTLKQGLIHECEQRIVSRETVDDHGRILYRLLTHEAAHEAAQAALYRRLSGELVYLPVTSCKHAAHPGQEPLPKPIPFQKRIG